MSRHLPQKSPSHVGQHTSTMEDLGLIQLQLSTVLGFYWLNRSQHHRFSASRGGLLGASGELRFSDGSLMINGSWFADHGKIIGQQALVSAGMSFFSCLENMFKFKMQRKVIFHGHVCLKIPTDPQLMYRRARRIQDALSRWAMWSEKAPSIRFCFGTTTMGKVWRHINLMAMIPTKMIDF